MASSDDQQEGAQVTLTIAGLTIPDEKREDWERSVASMAKTAESLSCLDPMEDEPLTRFDPRFS
jgi:hypothetical protein